jgi:RNA polymerase sigma-70 factor, ECF subfamily
MSALCIDQLEAHRATINHVCLRLMGDSQSAEDATQDTFARAISRLEQFRGDASPATWLSHIALNVCLNRLEKLRHSKEVLSLDDPCLPEVADSGPDPLAETERSIYLGQLLDAVAEEARSRVPPWDTYDYLVFELYLRGERTSWSAVGADLGVNPEKAKYHYYTHVVPVLRAVRERF